jgi:hypothetical protein
MNDMEAALADPQGSARALIRITTAANRCMYPSGEESPAVLAERREELLSSIDQAICILRPRTDEPRQLGCCGRCQKIS